MSISKVATNFEAMFARQNIQKMEMMSGKSMDRLASGKRINNASDDPSSIAALSAETASMQANRTVQQGLQESMELLKFADGVLAKIENTLLEMNDIAVRIGNDATLNGTTEIANAFNKLATTLNATNLANLKWNGQQVDGTNASFAAQRIVIDASGTQATVNTVMTGAFGNGWDIGTLTTGTTVAAATAATQIANIATDLDTIGGYRAEIGGYVNVLEQQLNTAMAMEVNHAAAVSAIGDADMAAEAANLGTASVLSQAATAMVAQANIQSQTILGLLGS